VRRKVLKKLKSNRRKQVVALELFTHDLNIEFSPEMILIEEEESYFKRAIVKDALNDLTKRQREVIYLKFYQELSYAEISEIMDMKYQSVLNLFQRALIKLRDNPMLLRVSDSS
jgi:RNA polymerase sigma factor (sigma-70 family)